MEEVDTADIVELIKRGYTYERISDTLKSRYQHVKRGMSSRSVRRFCKEHHIEKLNKHEPDNIVEKAVFEVRYCRMDINVEEI